MQVSPHGSVEQSVGGKGAEGWRSSFPARCLTDPFLPWNKTEPEIGPDLRKAKRPFAHGLPTLFPPVLFWRSSTDVVYKEPAESCSDRAVRCNGVVDCSQRSDELDCGEGQPGKGLGVLGLGQGIFGVAARPFLGTESFLVEPLGPGPTSFIFSLRGSALWLEPVLAPHLLQH